MFTYSVLRENGEGVLKFYFVSLNLSFFQDYGYLVYTYLELALMLS